MTKNEVVETIRTWIKNADDEYDIEEQGRVCGLMDALELIKQIEPEQKVGHWRKMVEVYDLQQNRMLVPYGYDDAKFGNTPVYVCECGCESSKNSRFCPDCGCRMVEPQESEEKA